MTKNQLINLYTFVGIMVLDNKLSGTAPSYFKEKCRNILGINGGRNLFIEYPKEWDEYVSLWKVNKEDYEIMNIYNFLVLVKAESSQFSLERRGTLNPKHIIELYKLYVGDVNKIPEDEYIRRAAHAIIQTFVLDFIDKIYAEESLVDYLTNHDKYWYSKHTEK